MKKDSRDTRKVVTRLGQEGWIQRKGKGDHLNFFKPGNTEIITVDAGKKEIDKNIYRRIKRIAWWD